MRTNAISRYAHTPWAVQEWDGVDQHIGPSSSPQRGLGLVGQAAPEPRKEKQPYRAAATRTRLEPRGPAMLVKTFRDGTPPLGFEYKGIRSGLLRTLSLQKHRGMRSDFCKPECLIGFLAPPSVCCYL